MSKEKRGTKRLCASCENKFYDLGSDPIICPICETPFILEKPEPRPSHILKKPKRRPKPKTAPAPSEEQAAGEDVDVDAKLADLGDDEVDIPPDDNKDALLVDDED